MGQSPHSISSSLDGAKAKEITTSSEEGDSDESMDSDLRIKEKRTKREKAKSGKSMKEMQNTPQTFSEMKQGLDNMFTL